MSEPCFETRTGNGADHRVKLAKHFLQSARHPTNFELVLDMANQILIEAGCSRDVWHPTPNACDILLKGNCKKAKRTSMFARRFRQEANWGTEQKKTWYLHRRQARRAASDEILLDVQGKVSQSQNESNGNIQHEEEDQGSDETVDELAKLCNHYASEIALANRAATNGDAHLANGAVHLTNGDAHLANGAVHLTNGAAHSHNGAAHQHNDTAFSRSGIVAHV
jgi:hypothetical protein